MGGDDLLCVCGEGISFCRVCFIYNVNPYAGMSACGSPAIDDDMTY